MLVSQVYELVNTAAKEYIGETAVLNEDLSNIKLFGEELFDATSVDNYVKSLVDHIAKVIFVNRPYSGIAPSLYADAWEFGAVLEKVNGGLYEAQENEAWNLQDGKVYETQQFYKPVATVKFFSNKETFMIPISITEKQVKSAFSTPTQLNSFISMIFNDIEKSLTARIDKLILMTLATMTGKTIKDGVEGKTKYNLLKEYNTLHGTHLTTTTCMTDPEFIRYAILRMNLTCSRMRVLGKAFNIGKQPRFTTKDHLKCVMLDEFKESVGVYLYNANGQFNVDHLKLAEAETVPFWQGQGDKFEFEEISKIHVQLPDNGGEVEQTGIIAVAFDKEAIMMANTNKYVTAAPYNAVGEFTNNYFKYENSFFIDTNENFVVFYIAD